MAPCWIRYSERRSWDKTSWEVRDCRTPNTLYLVSKCCLKQISKVTSTLALDYLSESKTQLVNQRKQNVADQVTSKTCMQTFIIIISRIYTCISICLILIPVFQSNSLSIILKFLLQRKFTLVTLFKVIELYRCDYARSDSTQIAKFMGPTWAHLGPVGPRWAPCWPHDPCYRGSHCCRSGGGTSWH